MDKTYRVFGMNFIPLVVIEGALAINLLAFGTYIGFYTKKILAIPGSLFPGGSGIVGLLNKVLVNKWSILAFALVCILAGMSILYGLYKKNTRFVEWGLYSAFLLELYAVVATILTQGFLNLAWFNAAFIMVVAGTLWLWHRKR